MVLRSLMYISRPSCIPRRPERHRECYVLKHKMWCWQEAYTCGLVTECCVKATTLDALKEGFSKVAVVADACRGMGDDEAVFKELAAQGASIVHVADCL